MDRVESTSRSAAGRRWVVIALVVAMAGLAVRLTIAATTIGSNDTLTWRHFGEMVSAYGLFESYRLDELLNHPPLPVLWARLCRMLSGPNDVRFGFWMKLPAIVADGATCWMLWWFGVRTGGEKLGAKLVGLMALNPVTILIGAYHGNTDNVYACLSLAAFLLVERGRFFAAGLMLGAAANVKIIPLLLVPALLLQCRTWPSAARTAAGIALTMLVFVPVALGAGFVFVRRLFDYRSLAEHWGVPLLMWMAVWNGVNADYVRPIAAFFTGSWGRLVIVALLCTASLLSRFRRIDARAAAASVACLFLVLAPGFGIQYLALPAALLIAASPRFALYFAAAGGLFSGSVYYTFLNRQPTPYSAFFGQFFLQSYSLGLIVWAILAAYVVRTFAVAQDETTRRLLASRLAGTADATRKPPR